MQLTSSATKVIEIKSSQYKRTLLDFAKDIAKIMNAHTVQVDHVRYAHSILVKNGTEELEILKELKNANKKPESD